jgi:hypothetical protein
MGHALKLGLVIVWVLLAGCQVDQRDGGAAVAPGSDKVAASQPAQDKIVELLKATVHKDAAQVRSLLAADHNLANSRYVDGDYSQPLFQFAVSSKSPEIVSAFVRAGADVNLRARGFTPLDCAIMSRDKEMIRLLVRSGADLRGGDRMGRSALTVAQEEGDEGIVAELRALGAKEACAATLIECPNGHKKLRDIPVAYGYPGPGMGEKAEKHEIILGGCMPGPTKIIVQCQQCGYEYDTYYNHWKQRSKNPRDFTPKLSNFLLSLPFPSYAEPEFDQELRRGVTVYEAVWFYSEDNPKIVTDRIAKHLESRGLKVETKHETADTGDSFTLIAALDGKAVKASIQKGESNKDTSVHFEITSE